MRVIVSVVVLVSVLAASRMAAAADPQAPSSHPAAAAAQAPAPQPAPATANPAASTPTPALEPQGYTYDPESRRDPFVSLMRRGAEIQRTTDGGRAAGLAGLASGEITVKGILASRSGFVAMVQGADNKTYVVHPGEALLDGTIRTITANAIVILQQVNDPLSPQKQREIRKALRETGEAR